MNWNSIKPRYFKHNPAPTKFLFIFWLIIIATPAFAKNESHKLQKVVHNISVVKENIKKNEHKESKIETELQTTETNIGNLEISAKHTKQNLQHEQTILNNLSTSQKTYQQKLILERKLFLNQVRTAYMLGNEDFLKVLLNQEDPSKFSRMLVYHHYILASRLDLINDISDTLTQLKRNKIKIREQKTVLETLQNTQNKQQTELVQEKLERKQILVTIKHQLNSQHTKLKNLVIAKENLETLIASISKKSVYQGPRQTVTQICSKYVWPTSGRISQHFGLSIHGSSWKSNGILIEAHDNQEVHAVAAGTVAYSGWLAGYGLLIIIDHGRGYMSLYGRNHSIYKKVGDSVDSGEIIATVGQSGGYEKPELYFALRLNGKPLNPETWCRKI